MDALTPADPFAVISPEHLRQIYGPPLERAVRKVIHALDDKARAFITASPFCLLATGGARGLHCTPRGDAAGFVVPLDSHTLALPDRRGNNRIDALQDVLEDPRVALLFLVPGAGETLRVNGRARLTADPTLRERFAVGDAQPATVMLVAVEEVYMQCARALHRSRLWGERKAPAGVPTAGQMLEAHTGGLVEAESYDATIYARAMQTLY